MPGVDVLAQVMMFISLVVLARDKQGKDLA